MRESAEHAAIKTVTMQDFGRGIASTSSKMTDETLTDSNGQLLETEQVAKYLASELEAKDQAMQQHAEQLALLVQSLSHAEAELDAIKAANAVEPENGHTDSSTQETKMPGTDIPLLVVFGGTHSQQICIQAVQLV